MATSLHTIFKNISWKEIILILIHIHNGHRFTYTIFKNIPEQWYCVKGWWWLKLAKIEHLVWETCSGPHFDWYIMSVNYIIIIIYTLQKNNTSIFEMISNLQNKCISLCSITYWMIYKKVSCKIDAQSFLLEVCTNIKHGMICEKKAHRYKAWICCWFGLELFCKKDIQPSSIWNQATIVLTLRLRHSMNVNVRCFAKGVSTLLAKQITVLFHYFIILLLIYTTD